MKIAIQCDSPLLQRSLELFLKDHLSSIRQCDVVVRDKNISDPDHPTFVIALDGSGDIVKPFTKAQLIDAIKHKMISPAAKTPTVEETSAVQRNDEKVSFEILERHIEKLTREYQANILKAIRAFYEK